MQCRNYELMKVVRNVLTESGLTPNRLELEITENGPLLNNETIFATLHQLSGLGVRMISGWVIRPSGIFRHSSSTTSRSIARSLRVSKTASSLNIVRTVANS